MYGALYVVADLEAYLADPEAYLAKNPLPIADELLKFNRPRKEWKFEELAAEVEKIEGRPVVRDGKQMFTVASCVSCHKFERRRPRVRPGPDEARPEDGQADRDPAEHILEPSLKIDDKYRSWTFDLTTGKTVTGMILEKKDGAYKVIENPLAKAEPMVIKEGGHRHARRSRRRRSCRRGCSTS